MTCIASIIHHPAAEGFGLYEIDCDKLNRGGKTADPTAITLFNIIGWIPVIGAIIGAIRLCVSIPEYNEKSGRHRRVDQEDVETAKGHIARGVCEILCLGPLLAIIDIIVTLARLCFPKPEVVY